MYEPYFYHTHCISSSQLFPESLKIRQLPKFMSSFRLNNTLNTINAIGTGPGHLSIHWNMVQLLVGTTTKKNDFPVLSSISFQRCYIIVITQNSHQQCIFKVLLRFFCQFWVFIHTCNMYICIIYDYIM